LVFPGENNATHCNEGIAISNEPKAQSMKLTDVRPAPFTYALQCDKCAVVLEHDALGFDEFVHIENHCGYATVEDDGSHIEVDLCFPCFKALIGPYWRVRSNWISPLQSGSNTPTLGLDSDEQQ
jgi:hypothetical protein